MTPLERLLAAGIKPCQTCRWKNGLVVDPCVYHHSLIRWSMNQHVAKFPPLNAHARRLGYSTIYKVA